MTTPFLTDAALEGLSKEIREVDSDSTMIWTETLRRLLAEVRASRLASEEKEPERKPCRCGYPAGRHCTCGGDCCGEPEPEPASAPVTSPQPAGAPSPETEKE